MNTIEFTESIGPINPDHKLYFDFTHKVAEHLSLSEMESIGQDDLDSLAEILNVNELSHNPDLSEKEIWELNLAFATQTLDLQTTFFFISNENFMRFLYILAFRKIKMA